MARRLDAGGQRGRGGLGSLYLPARAAAGAGRPVRRILAVRTTGEDRP
jgi:hypothetical protein